MTIYEESEPEDGYHETTLTFFWKDDREDGPQYVTIDFRVTSEMEEDLPGQEELEKHGAVAVEEMMEDWLQENILTLLDFGFVTDAYGNKYIESVEDLEEELENMNYISH